MNTNELMHEFMRMDFIQNLSEEEQTAVWKKLNIIVNTAQLKIVEDAEKQIAKLRTFSLGR